MSKKLAEKVKHHEAFYIVKISVNSIIIDETQNVTIWAFTDFGEEKCFFYLAITTTQLNQIFKYCGKQGKALELEIAEQLIAATDFPILIETTDFEIDKLAMKLYAAFDIQEGLAGAAWNVFCLEDIYVKI